nr:MAG: nucleoprotein [Rhabdoviridae sp.]
MAVPRKTYFVKEGEPGELVNFPKLLGTQARVFPSEYFNKNGHKKPKIVLPKDTLTIEQLRGSLSSGITLSQASVEHAVLYLHKFGSRITGKLAEPWESFGVKLGETGSELTPWSLLEIVFSDVPPPAAPDGTGVMMSEEGLFGYILFIYRVLSVRDRGTAAYRTEIHAKLSQLLSAAPFKTSKADFSGAGSSYVSWLSEPAYMAMVAAIDMFLCKFPNNLYSTVRVGTMPSRYKDCSVFMALCQAVHNLAVPVDELYRWMFVREVAKEAHEMISGTEELEMEDSYSAYLSDLRLVTKSPYSAVTNPRLHSWLHCLGSLLLETRSLNARHLSDASFHQILANTIILAFVRKRSTGFTMSYVDTAQQAESEGKLIGKQDHSINTEKMPSNIVAASWFAWLADEGFVVPDSMYEFFSKVMEGAPPLRDGSVGKKVKSSLEAWRPTS